jgi:hypothetical protein
MTITKHLLELTRVSLLPVPKVDGDFCIVGLYRFGEIMSKPDVLKPLRLRVDKHHRGEGGSDCRQLHQKEPKLRFISLMATLNKQPGALLLCNAILDGINTIISLSHGCWL